MTDLKITKGEWRVGNLMSYDGYTGQPYRNVWAGLGEDRTVVARAIRSDGAMNNDVDADTELIAEAGNVYNETGLTPRELLEQRDELLNAVKDCMTWIKNWSPNFSDDPEWCEQDRPKIENAIAKAEG